MSAPETKVQRYRKLPVVVDMIRWDGSEEAWQLIANHGGLPERLPDGSINIWVGKSDAEMNLDAGDWAAIEPDGSGVYPLTAAVHAATYEPAGPEPAGLNPDDGQSVALAKAERIIADRDHDIADLMRTVAAQDAEIDRLTSKLIATQRHGRPQPDVPGSGMDGSAS